MSGFRVSVWLAAMFSLTACPSRSLYSVRRFEAGTAQNGLVYALPTTEIRVELEVTRSVVKCGAHSLRAEAVGVPQPETCSANQGRWRVKTARITTVSVPDPQARYVIDFHLDRGFADRQLEFVATDDGRLTSTNARSTDQTTQVAADAIRIATTVAGGVVGAISILGESASPPTLGPGAEERALRLARTDAARLRTLVTRRGQVMIDPRTLGPNINAELYRLTLQMLDDEIRELRGRFGRTEVTEDARVYAVVRPRSGPLEQRERSPQSQSNSLPQPMLLRYCVPMPRTRDAATGRNPQESADTPGGGEAPGATAASTAERPSTSATTDTPPSNGAPAVETYLVVLEQPAVDSCGDGEIQIVVALDAPTGDLVTPPVGEGFVYRVPRGAVISVQSADHVVAREVAVLGQFGGLARLPVEESRRSGSMRLALSPTTGGVQSLTVQDRAYEPVVANAVQSGVQTLADAGVALATQQREAAEARRTASDPVRQLERERDVLRLRQQIACLEAGRQDCIPAAE